jgi:Mce-associated membrane protein
VADDDAGLQLAEVVPSTCTDFEFYREPEPEPQPEPTGVRALLARLSHVQRVLIGGSVVVAVLAGLTGWLGYQAYRATETEQLEQLFIQAGRQGAVNLTSIDYEHADADVQRILDSTTGQFYDDFVQRAQPFAETAKQAQSKSVGTVTEAGLETMAADEGRVLVTITVQAANRGAQQPLKVWRMRVTVKKVGDDQAKVSRVEFIQ